MRLLHRLLLLLEVLGVAAAVAFWRFGGSRGGWKRREGGIRVILFLDKEKRKER